MNLIDTETKALLQRQIEPPLAPAKVAEFALVLGPKGVDRERLIRAVCRINDCGRAAAVSLLGQPSPVIVNLDLTEEEAVFGQFELVCCDIGVKPRYLLFRLTRLPCCCPPHPMPRQLHIEYPGAMYHQPPPRLRLDRCHEPWKPATGHLPGRR